METSKDRYTDYLKSDYWKRVSDAVKAKAGYRCQVCNSPHDLQAHHRTYEHRGRELEFIEDMTCLCRRCHNIFHGGSVSNPQVKSEAAEMILITVENHKRLRSTKEPWHWMLTVGIDPRKSGWAKRAIGHTVPSRWLRYAVR